MDIGSDLQPESGRSLNQVAVAETVIRLGGEQYWLYAAVDPETNDLLHTQLEPTTNNAFADRFFATLRDKHNVDDATVLVDEQLHFNQPVGNRISISATNDIIGTASNLSFMRVNAELPVSQTVLATPKQKLLTSGSDRSRSHGISLSEHYRSHSTSTYMRRFDLWTDALAAAGLDTPDRNRISDAELIVDLHRLRNELGERPTSTDVARDGEYGLPTYQRRFGSVG